MADRSYAIQVNVELRLTIETESLDDAKRLGVAAGEFLLQCARWEELRELQEIHLVDAVIDPSLVREVPGETEGHSQGARRT